MVKRLFFVFVGGLLSLTGYSQNVLDGAYLRENSPALKVVPLAYLREADVMWSKKIWRYIDCTEKINLPLRYPLEDMTNDRKSLMQLLLTNVNEGALTAYDVLDDEFTKRMTLDEIKERCGSKKDTQQITDLDPPYLTRDTVVEKKFSTDKVVGYRLKEEWFFDKQRSVLDVRIIGLAPMVFAEDEAGNKIEGGIKKALFWIYYPEARNILVNYETFNRGNEAERRTFDEILMKRMFNSLIYKESNVYDRRIGDYTVAPIDAILESERIKNELMILEHDLWEY
ncbi:MAG TPA: gliding motility protein GldN [Bacteroidia bacterium]|nr:gliding motility protein GldN [Bacteroidia bacterium]